VFSFIILSVALEITSDVSSVATSGQGQLQMFEAAKTSYSYPPRSACDESKLHEE
jgi:hypothetical protein